MRNLIILSLFICSAVSFAEPPRFEKYFVNHEDDSRWKIPGPDDEVAGNQNFWFVTPYDIRKGSFSMSVKGDKLTDFTETSFTFIPSNVWGDFQFKVTALAEVPKEDMKTPSWPSVSSSRITWANFPEVKTALIIGGRVTETAGDGKSFKAEIDLKTGKLPAEFKVVSEKRKAEFPQILSRLYGPHYHQTFDVYYPEGFTPGKDPALPVLLQIHGGGWGALDKGPEKADGYNKAGYAYISINYRFVSEYTQKPAMTVPVAAPLLDAARCLQYLRYNSKELGIDPDRICPTGGSAGGATACWLAMVDDLAVPDAEDPVSRMSTRAACSIPVQAQTSLDPKQMKEWIPEITYGHHAFFDRGRYKELLKLKKGEEQFQFFLDHREEAMPYILDFSAYHQASKDDPPMLLNYGGQKDAVPALDGGNATHHPRFGVHLRERLLELGVKCWFWCDDRKDKEYAGEYAGWGGNIKFMDEFLKKKMDNGK